MGHLLAKSEHERCMGSKRLTDTRLELTDSRYMAHPVGARINEKEQVIL